MKIEVNEFVRTKNGKIRKITEEYQFNKYGKFWFLIKENNKIENCNEYFIDTITEKDIVKHSNDIIDLIEIGDILRILDNLGGCEHKVDIDDKIFLEETKNNFKDKTWKLLSILTHEQFSSLEYII